MKTWFASEASEAKKTAEMMKSSLETEMDRREANLGATPAEKLNQIQSEIDDDPFAEVRSRIDDQSAHADAIEELATDAPAASEDAARSLQAQARAAETPPPPD